MSIEIIAVATADAACAPQLDHVSLNFMLLKGEECLI